MKNISSKLTLGILGTTLSILATLANYVGVNFFGRGDSHTTKARQHLVDANREDGKALQLLFVFIF